VIPPLLPAPRHTLQAGEGYRLPAAGLVLLDAAHVPALLPAARRFLAARAQHTHDPRASSSWEAAAGYPAEQAALILRLHAGSGLPDQGYRLSIRPEGMRIEASSASGVFYGVCTLLQLIESCGPSLPGLEIEDWPDFPARGVMLDVSRDRVPSMETLFALVDLLAGWKINQLQLYTEHTFAYRRHPQVWAQASPLTGQEILLLDEYCRERFIELVPNQNSFGHMHRWLQHPTYAPLAEVLDGYNAPWGRMEGPNSLCPTDPRSLELLRGLYDELLPHFTSRMFNVGCDETFDLGQGRSKEACEREGAGKVYLDFLLKLHREVSARGRQMQYWGDIITQHPELVPRLPQDAIALEWGYEADHPFDEHSALFASAGLPFYVCPGTSSWCSLAGRSDNALGNLLTAAENGLKHGAAGYLITDWGDYGHWQPLPVSYLGFAAGAAFSWGLEANRDLDLPQALDRFAFRDRAGVMGCLAYNLGNLYRLADIVWLHASPLFSILQRPFAQLSDHPKIRSIPYARLLERLVELAPALEAADMERPDAELIRREYRQVLRLLRHACRRGRLAVSDDPSLASLEAPALARDLEEILQQQAGLWLERSRPGGREDSLRKLAAAGIDYQA